MKCNKKDETEDLFFSELFRQITEEEGNRLLQEAEKLNNDPACALPPELEERCLCAAQRAEKQNRCRRRLRVMCRALTHTAVCLAVVVAMFSTLYITVDAVRDGVRRALFREKKEYVEITIDGSKMNLADWEGTPLAPSWLPKYLTQLSRSESEYHVSIQYYNPENAEQNFQYFCKSAGGLNHLDSEDADVYKVDEFMGYQSVYIEKEDRITLYWYDTDLELTFTLIGNGISKREITKIAKSVYD